jgi:hypothetical protein
MTRDDLNLEHQSADELMMRIAGTRIKGGVETEDGLHMFLEGGRVLIFTGEFIICVYRQDEEVVH